MTAIYATVGAARHPNQDPRDEGTALGDVRYASKANARVSEKEWIGLVRSIAGGDQLALHALYAQTHRIVFTLIVRITNNRETAEELTLDVFHDVWRRASTYDAAGGSVVGWIMNQTRSRAIDRLRFEQRKKRVNHRADSPLLTTVASDPHEAFDLRERAEPISIALGKPRAANRGGDRRGPGGAGATAMGGAGMERSGAGDLLQAARDRYGEEPRQHDGAARAGSRLSDPSPSGHRRAAPA